MKTEKQIVEYESNLIVAMDKWFNARPGVPRDRHTEKIFEGGFRMAWDMRLKDNE